MVNGETLEINYIAANIVTVWLPGVKTESAFNVTLEMPDDVRRSLFTR